MSKKKAAPDKPKPPVSTRPDVFKPDPKDPKQAVQVGPQKVDTEGYSGSYRKLDEPKGSEPYKLKIVDEAEAAEHYGRDHHLINQEHFWAGTKEDFQKTFEKN